MDGLLRDPAQLSQLESHVTQQRYDESLELLDHAIARNPNDRPLHLCRLLILRILVLRHLLTSRREHSFALTVRSLSSSLVRSVGHLGCHRPMLVSNARDFLTAQVRRLRSLLQDLRSQAGMDSRPRFTLFTAARETLPLKHLPGVVASALGVLAIIAVSAVFLRSADTSDRPTSVTRESKDVALREVPYQPGMLATARKLESSLQRTEASPVVAEPVTKFQANAELRGVKTPIPMPQAALPRESVTVVERKNTPSGDAKLSAYFYRVRRPISVRKAAQDIAPAVEQLSEGAVVAVLDIRNSWARVTLYGKAPGFVRIEHLGPVEVP